MEFEIFYESFNGFDLDAFNEADLSSQYTQVYQLPPSQGGTPTATASSSGGAEASVGRIASTTATGAGIGASVGGPLGAGIGAGVGGMLGLFGEIF